jgi:hypothetical protein
MHRQSGPSSQNFIATNAFAALDTAKKAKKKKTGKDKDDKSKKDKSKSASQTSGPPSRNNLGYGTSTISAGDHLKLENIDWAAEDDDDGFEMTAMAPWLKVRVKASCTAQGILFTKRVKNDMA